MPSIDVTHLGHESSPLPPTVTASVTAFTVTVTVTVTVATKYHHIHHTASQPSLYCITAVITNVITFSAIATAAYLVHDIVPRCAVADRHRFYSGVVCGPRPETLRERVDIQRAVDGHSELRVGELVPDFPPSTAVGQASAVHHRRPRRLSNSSERLITRRCSSKPESPPARPPALVMRKSIVCGSPA